MILETIMDVDWDSNLLVTWYSCSALKLKLFCEQRTALRGIVFSGHEFVMNLITLITREALKYSKPLCLASNQSIHRLQSNLQFSSCCTWWSLYAVMNVGAVFYLQYRMIQYAVLQCWLVFGCGLVKWRSVLMYRKR